MDFQMDFDIQSPPPVPFTLPPIAASSPQVCTANQTKHATQLNPQSSCDAA